MPSLVFVTSQPRFQNEATAPESTNLEHFTTHTGEEEGCVNSISSRTNPVTTTFEAGEFKSIISVSQSLGKCTLMA